MARAEQFFPQRARPIRRLVNPPRGEFGHQQIGDILIWRYDHADLDSLADTCDRALEVSAEERRQVYDHFNREETVGAVVAAALHAAGAPAQA